MHCAYCLLLTAYLMMPSHSPKTNWNLPINRLIRAMTVYPNAAPNPIIMKMMPIREETPSTPLCSLEK